MLTRPLKLTNPTRSGGAYGVSAGVSSIWQRTKSDATQVTAKEGNREIHAVYNVSDLWFGASMLTKLVSTSTSFIGRARSCPVRKV